MGIIIKQSIKGSFWSYLGVIVGFITTSYLFPRYLTTDVVGLFGILVSWSVWFAQFSTLGFNGVTARMFAYFRNNKNKHNGFLFIAFSVMLIGALLFLGVFLLLKPYLLESNVEKSRLFTDYINYLIPLSITTLLFLQLDVFNRVLYDAVLGTFLQEFLQRVFVFISTILYALQLIDLNVFILFYTASVCLKGVLLFLYLIIKKQINLKPSLSYVKPKLRSEMVSVALFSILTGLGTNIVFNIDKIIINQMLGLSPTGVYTIAFFFGTLVVIPSRPLLKISGTLIAEAFKKKDLTYIKEIYYKSCLNQFVIGAFLFGGIWVNIDNILVILGEDYSEGKWVIFFIALGYLFDMSTGANGNIISYSKYYKVALYFILTLIIAVVVSMLLLLPKWGIIGAAVAICFSLFLNNLMRFIFILKKYKMQPFNSHFLVGILILLIAYFVSYVFPKFELTIYDIIFRSTVFTLIYVVLMVLFKVSEDVNITVRKIFILLKTKLLKGLKSE